MALDNLNTHISQNEVFAASWSLYMAFDPVEAYRLMNCFEFHYTPEHGSWLNIAEIELSVMQRLCLNRRIAKEDIIVQVSAWEIARNELQGKVNWQFTTRDARVKLRPLYLDWQKEGTKNV
ncbi:MAG: transposase [Armatimonadetes bacterium]|nr:transposase [Armatimonadota bacterium]